MITKPKYDNYTIKELLEVQRSIDREKYPERAEEVDKMIDFKMNDPEEAKKMEILMQKEKYSTFAPRFCAALLDGIFIKILSLGFLFVGSRVNDNDLTLYNNSQVLLFILYTIFFHGMYGQTFGKMAFNIKIVDCETEKNINFVQALLRDCVPFVIVIAFTIYNINFPTVEDTYYAPAWANLVIGILSLVNFLWVILEILSMLFNDKRRSINDFIAKTVVVRT